MEDEKVIISRKRLESLEKENYILNNFLENKKLYSLKRYEGYGLSYRITEIVTNDIIIKKIDQEFKELSEEHDRLKSDLLKIKEEYNFLISAPWYKRIFRKKLDGCKKR